MRGSIYIVIAIVDDLWFDDGDEAGLLTLFSVLGEVVAVFDNGLFGGGDEAAPVV